MNLRNASENKTTIKNLAGKKMHRESNRMRNLRVSQTNVTADMNPMNKHVVIEGILSQSN